MFGQDGGAAKGKIPKYEFVIIWNLEMIKITSRCGALKPSGHDLTHGLYHGEELGGEGWREGRDRATEGGGWRSDPSSMVAQRRKRRQGKFLTYLRVR